MKKFIAFLLLAVLTVLCSYGLFACRSFKKSRSTADSTVTRSVEQKQAWQAETIQELVIETDDFSFVQPSLPLPSILGLSGQEPAGLLEKLGFVKPDSNLVKARPPSKKKGGARLILRKITRQSSKQSSELHEEKQVSAAETSKSREPANPWLPSIFLIIIALLIIFTILFKSKRPD